jgi:hypothetical protein
MYYPHKPQEDPEPFSCRRVPVGAPVQATEHHVLSNLLPVHVQIAKKVGFQTKEDQTYICI